MAGERRGWTHRLHAALLRRVSERHDRLVADRKRALLEGISGRVLEIGPGTGINFRYYPPGLRWTGVEPNVFFRQDIEREGKTRGIEVEIVTAEAEKLPFPDSTFDWVVGTLVLCSVHEPETVIAEVLRVLKPGGRYVYVEHVADLRGTPTRRRQERIAGLWRRISDGCHPNRETAIYLECSAHGYWTLDWFRLPLPIVGPHVTGYLEKGAPAEH